MSTSGDVTLVVAIAATVIGTVVAAVMWRRQVRHERASRRTHPSMQPPLALTVIDAASDGEPARRWRVTVRPDAAPISVDIVTYRASGSRQPWSSEPIVEPIRIEPGGSEVLSSQFDRESAYDAVVGWTEHRADGDVERSRTFHVLDVAAGPVTAMDGGTGGRRRPQIDLIVTCLLLAALALAVWGFTARDDREDDAGGTATTSGASPAATTQPPAATTPTSVPPTTESAPDETTSTSVATTSTTETPTTTTPTTTMPEGPRVEIFGRVGECQFGSSCLIAGFRLVDFTSSPTEYVCEFADGGRVTFRFGGDGVDTACATGSADAAITIEVDDVRSETITKGSIDQDSTDDA